MSEVSFLSDSTFWVGTSFIIFIILAWKPLSSLLNESLNGKINDIIKTIENAKKLKDESNKILTDYQEKEQIIQQETLRIIEDAKTESKYMERQSSENLEKLLIKKKESFEQRLSQNEKNIETTIYNKIIEVAVSVTSKRIEKDLSNKKNNLIIEDSIDELRINPD